MSYQNELTKQQERNFKRRARFTACGEPCDVFAGPSSPDDSTAHDVMFMTVNRNTKTGAAWIEATSYIYADPTGEIRPDYLKLCSKIDEADARKIIARELHRWASMPEGTITGYTPEQIAAEADRISKQA
jgi:hypothetical protein